MLASWAEVEVVDLEAGEKDSRGVLFLQYWSQCWLSASVSTRVALWLALGVG